MSERSGDLSGDEQNSGLSLSPGASLGSSSAEGELPVCRDYLRNVCKRGKRCKFRHPNTGMSDTSTGSGAVPPSGGSDSSAAEMNGHCTTMKTISDVTASLARPPTRDPLLGNLNFCHDFQNAGCRRPNCKFLHCTREEEEYYKQTGHLPLHLQHLVALGIGLSHATDLPLARGEIPVCKDHLKGGCRRGNKCKFRHVSQTDLDLELLARTHAPNLSAINMAAAGHVTAPPSVTPGAMLPANGPTVPISTTPATVSPATAHAAAAASAHHIRGCSIGFNMGANGVLFDSHTASFMLDPTNPAGAAAAVAAAAAANYPAAGAAPCATPGPGTPAPGSDPLFEFVKRRRLEAALEAAPTTAPPPALHTVLHTPSFTPSFMTATPLPPNPATTGLGAYGAVDNAPRIFAGPQMALTGAGDDAGILRKKYDELRRVNADLMAANDLLLEQNAHLRNKLADHANMVAASVASTVAQVRNPIVSAAHSALSVVNSLSQRDPIPAVAAVLAPPNAAGPPQACPVTCVPAPSLSSMTVSGLAANHLSVSLAAATNGVPPPPPPPPNADLASFSGSSVIPPPPPPPQSAPGNAASAMGPPPPPTARGIPSAAAWLTGVIPAAVGLQ